MSPFHSNLVQFTRAALTAGGFRISFFLPLLAGILVSDTCVQAAGFVVDHRHVDLFERIPDEFVTGARNLRMLFSDRSVGQNIHDALNCFTAPSWAQTPSSCRRDYYDTNWNWKTFTQADRDAGRVPARILFNPDPVKYARSNWTYELRSGSWSELTKDFIQSLAPSYLASKDVLSYQFSYLNVTETDDIAHPTNGFFGNRPDRYDVHDLEAFMATHPDKIFVWWTTSLARGIGTRVSTDFNQQMRQYARAQGKILFDAADILSHRHDGRPAHDNRDGVPYTSMTGQSENYPDDGFDYPAICQDYTTETDGGHLGSVSAGGIRVVKGMWVLMARVAGWKPSVLPDDWLWQYGLNWDGSDDHADTDGDGMDNWSEFMAGTNPTNGASCLKLQISPGAVGTDAFLLTWPSETGRWYRIESTVALPSTAWFLLASNLPAAPPRNTLSNAALSSPASFFRVGVRTNREP